MMHVSRTALRRGARAWLATIVVALFASACSGTERVDGSAGDAHDVASEARGPCRVDNDCSDNLFCNGAERCMPGAATADSFGCVAAEPPNPCLAGQRCDDANQRCVSICAHVPDADGDGHRAVDCGGDDCDDSDSNRFPGNPEVCDANAHDEDCDPTSFGFRDTDHDDYVDSHCCNTDSMSAMHCGDDCNDSRPNVHPAIAEVCDGLDNNCDGATDEGAIQTFYPDRDGDGYGDAMAAASGTMTGCLAPAGYAASHNDCDDNANAVHPGALEQCDAASVDENCDGVINPPSICTCSGDVTRMCATATGVCAAGTERCVSGSWGLCSIGPTPETCNGLDDDCNGMVDEGLSVTCYPDGDNDGYAAAGATPAHVCPVPGRDAFAGCPPNQTNRAPVGGTAIDCNDANSTVSPGASELCDSAMPPVDEDCDGTANPASLCACVDGTTRPCMSSGSCGAGIQSCSGGRFGACSITPTTESCNGIDDNCNGTVDEGLTVTCYADNDNDGYAAAGSMALQSCPVTGRDGVGGCPTNQTNRIPSGATIDCNDANAAISPGAIELCDGARVDENCDGTANPASLCTCSGSTTRMCPLPGPCAAGRQTCTSGSWSACSIAPVAESCNGEDDNCNGTVDEGLTVTCFVDNDNDGFAATGAAMSSQCPLAGRESVGGCPTGYTNRAPSGTNIDCNDMAGAGSAISPSALETCNGVDDNCNGSIDEGVAFTFYRDADGDGFGTTAAGMSMSRCVAPAGYVSNATDCNDAMAAVHPGAVESCNALDDNCNGMIDEGLARTWYRDADGDTWGVATMTMSQCAQPAGYAAQSGDCNDTAGAGASIHPGATEVCNGADDNCSGTVDEGVQLTFYRDADGDLYGAMGTSMSACSPPTGYVANGLDCNDTNFAIHPGVPETCDAVDNDCDGTLNNGSAASTCTAGLPGTNWSCSAAGACAIATCQTGYANCNAMVADGCEARLTTDPLNCGACATNCGIGGTCTASVCDYPIEISAGAHFTYVRRSSGNLVSWGANDRGQLGQNDTVERHTPALVSTIANATMISAANDISTDANACALSGSTVYCVGPNTYGQIGDGTFAGPRLGFTATSGIGSGTFQSLVVGSQTATAVRANTRYEWGRIGYNYTTTNIPQSGYFDSGAVDAGRGDVGAGADGICYITGGRVECEGGDDRGQLGSCQYYSGCPYSPTRGRVMNIRNAVELAGVTAISLADRFACGVFTGNNIYCWGNSYDGELADSTTSGFVTYPAGVTGFAAVETGGTTTCALTTSGSVFCWGHDDAGQCGQGSTGTEGGNFDRLTPSQVRTSATAFLNNVVSISVGFSHSCAIDTLHRVWCWGSNTNGEIGDGTVTQRLYARRITTL